MKLLRVGLRRAIAFAALLLAASCGGSAVGREHAVEYFREHRPAFEQIVAQVELCLPPHGRFDRNHVIQCSNPNGSIRDLVAAMTAENVEWIYVSRHGDERRSLAAVHVVVHSCGYSFAGVIEEFVYEVAPVGLEKYELIDHGPATTERMPVTEAPHHWYWRKLDR